MVDDGVKIHSPRKAAKLFAKLIKLYLTMAAHGEHLFCYTDEYDAFTYCDLKAKAEDWAVEQMTTIGDGTWEEIV